MNKQPGSSLKKAFKIRSSNISDFEISDRIGGNNPNDLYRFKLKSSSSVPTQVDISLSNLKRNADLELYELKSSPEKLNQTIGRLEFGGIRSKKLQKHLTTVLTSCTRTDELFSF